MYTQKLALFAAIALGLNATAVGTDQYLAKDGTLTEPLEVRYNPNTDVKGGLTYSFLVSRDGGWSVVTHYSPKTAKKFEGKLDKSALTKFAIELAKFDALTLKDSGDTRDPRQIVSVKFGAHEAELSCSTHPFLWSGDHETETVEHRFAGVMETVKKAIAGNPDHYLAPDGKLREAFYLSSTASSGGKGPRPVQHREVKIDVDGKWLRSTWKTITGKKSDIKEAKGTLTQREIASFAKALAKNEFFTILDSIGPLDDGTSSYRLTLRFGEATKALTGRLPSAHPNSTKFINNQRIEELVEMVGQLTKTKPP